MKDNITALLASIMTVAIVTAIVLPRERYAPVLVIKGLGTGLQKSFKGILGTD